MNIMLRPADIARTTQAAEGLPRRRWTVAEIEAMVRAGIIPEHERFELIGGEVVPMLPKGLLHETLKGQLMEFWMERKPKAFRMITETTFVEPDFVFYRTKDGLKNLRPDTCLLAVEVADSSLGYDLGRKAKVYASFGITELWVVNATSRITHVFSKPKNGAYPKPRRFGPSRTLKVAFASELDVKLSELPEV